MKNTQLTAAIALSGLFALTACTTDEEPASEAEATEETSPVETLSTGQDIFPAAEVENHLDTGRTERQSPQAIARLAAGALVIWDTGQDSEPAESERRARSLMDSDIYGHPNDPDRQPDHPEGWHEAAEQSAMSVPVTESGEETPAGPRTIEIHTHENGGETLVTDYTITEDTPPAADENPCHNNDQEDF